MRYKKGKENFIRALMMKLMMKTLKRFQSQSADHAKSLKMFHTMLKIWNYYSKKSESDFNNVVF
jgi:hypothetical protein